MTRRLIFGLLAVSWLSYALEKYALVWFYPIHFTEHEILLIVTFRLVDSIPRVPGGRPGGLGLRFGGLIHYKVSSLKPPKCYQFLIWVSPYGALPPALIGGHCQLTVGLLP